MSTITVDVFNLEKKKCGEIQLNTFVFKQDPRLDIISEMVRAGQAARRQGSHNVKTRAEVRGGGAKPFRQKGTGRARQGSSRSPLLRAGGVIHGPKPRKYSKKIGAKVKKLGIRSTLSYLFSKSAFVVVEDMTSKEGKTKELYQKLKNFSPRSLLVDDEKNLLFSRACRNLSSYQLLEVQGLNVYDLLKYEYVICTKSAVKKMHKIYGVDSLKRKNETEDVSSSVEAAESKSASHDKKIDSKVRENKTENASSVEAVEPKSASHDKKIDSKVRENKTEDVSSVEAAESKSASHDKKIDSKVRKNKTEDASSVEAAESKSASHDKKNEKGKEV